MLELILTVNFLQQLNSVIKFYVYNNSKNVSKPYNINKYVFTSDN